MAVMRQPRDRQRCGEIPAGTTQPAATLEAGGGAREGRGGGKGGNREAFLWVFRVVHMTSLTLKSFMEQRGIRVFSVDEVSHKGAAYKAFLVAVHEGDVDQVLKRDFWPGLVACRRWQEGDQRRGGTLSRRSARTNHRPASPPLRYIGGQGKVRPSTPPRPVEFRETQRTVSLAAASPASTDKNVKESKGRKSSRKNSDQAKRENGGQERKGDASMHKKKPARTRKAPSRKNSITDKNDKTGKQTNDNAEQKGAKNLENRTRKRSTVKTKKEKPVTSLGKKVEVKQRRQKPKQAWQAPQDNDTKIKDDANRQNKKHEKQAEHRSKPSRSRKSSLSTVDNNGEVNNRAARGDISIIDRSIRKRPYTKNISPGRKIGPKSSHTITVETSFSNPKYMIDPGTSQKKDTQTSQRSIRAERSHPDWSASLKWLLGRSSDEAVAKLLGPDYDKLLSQDDISDEELFLGVKVLAHCSRAKNTNQRNLQSLVHKIWQPHIINLFKSFAVAVECKYPERGEQYFWEMAEFLDLYVEGGSHIEGMASLITTCQAEVMALTYRHYVGSSLVKVYKGMLARIE